MTEDFGQHSQEDNENKSVTDTRSENNPVKSDEAYVQIFKCHFDPFRSFDPKKCLAK